MAVGSSIAAKSGRLFLLGLSDGTSPTTFRTVGGLRATGMVLNNNVVDITNKSSAGFREVLPDGGVQMFNLTGSGVMDANELSAWASLHAAALNRTFIEAKIISGKGDAFLGTFAVTQFNRDGPHNDAETYSITLESHGRVHYSASGNTVM